MSVTTVPLRPVSKGGLWLMWFGLAALLVAGAAFAWHARGMPLGRHRSGISVTRAKPP